LVAHPIGARWACTLAKEANAALALRSKTALGFRRALGAFAGGIATIALGSLALVHDAIVACCNLHLLAQAFEARVGLAIGWSIARLAGIAEPWLAKPSIYASLIAILDAIAVRRHQTRPR